jgi:hypothetical protein
MSDIVVTGIGPRLPSCAGRSTGSTGSAGSAYPDRRARGRRACRWQLAPAAGLGFAAPITRDEARLLEVLDPTGTDRHRAG